MATKFEYYDSGDDSQGGFFGSSWQSQTFTTTDAFTITLVKLLVARKGTSGTLTISIKAVDGNNKPTGADLCSKAIDSTVLTTDVNTGEWYEFVFVSSYALSAITRYAIVARCTGTDVDNRCYWRFDGSSPTYTNGELLFSSDSGSSWTALASADRLFETWGNPILPGKPTNPSPTDAVSNITLDETPLSWDASVDGNADTYEVYFREQGDDWELVGVAQAGVEWTIDFGILAYETTYEWRIDATNIYGTTTGDTWSFDTLDFDQIRVSYRLLPGGAGVGHGPYDDPPGTEGTDWAWTGENTMLTVKRLVAAANSKIWYESI